MALRTHEFVECQEGKENPGGLILSEVSRQIPRFQMITKDLGSSQARIVIAVLGVA